MSKITTFKELMSEIAYSYDYQYNEFSYMGDGEYCLNKLYIGPESVSYKTDYYELAPDVYQKFLVYLELLKDPDEEIN